MFPYRPLRLREALFSRRIGGMENQSLPVLTLEILEANHHNDWEPALTYPLPAEPSIDLIDAAIDEVLNGLSFVTSAIAQYDAAQARSGIERAAARLIELVEAKPRAFAAWLQQCERERLLRNFDSPTQH